jgi:hemolysin activation/secretion protein
MARGPTSAYALAVILSIPHVAWAQNLPDASRLGRDLSQEPQAIDRSVIAVPLPALADEVPAGADAQHFTLQGVEVEGAQVLGTDRMASLWQGQLGQRISLADAFGIAQRITQWYRSQGYVLSQAFLPAQSLDTREGSTLRIVVLEGRLGRVSVTGAEAAPLQPYLQRLLDERPLTQATLERVLLLINELPGVSAQGLLRAGQAPETSDLELVVQKRTWSGSAAMHNRVSDTQGPTRTELTLERRQLTTDFDRHTLRIMTSLNRRSHLVGYVGEWALGGDGLKVQAQVSGSHSEPSTVLPLDIASRSTTYGLSASYPIWRSRAANLGLRSSLGGQDSHTDSLLGTLGRDRIRTWRFGLSADLADSWAGVTLLDLEYTRGLSGLGRSSADDVRLNGASPEFDRWSLYAARAQSLGSSWSGLLAVSGQYANKRLTSGERMGLGGDAFLRAFDPSEVTGDRGMAAKLELRHNTSWRLIPLTPYAYADRGMVQQDPSVGGSTWLSATGLGLRFLAPRGWRGFVEWARPFGKAVTSTRTKSPRVLAGLAVDF